MPNLEAAWKAGGDGRIACNQVLYHLEERAIEHAVQPWCEDHGIAVVAYKPIRPWQLPCPRTPAAASWMRSRRTTAPTARQVAPPVPHAEAVHLHDPQGVQSEHAADNASAGPLRRTEDEFMRIDAAFPRGSPTTPPSML